MPSSDPGLSSPPVVLPTRKHLVRSHSSTSVGSLPTPPRTRKRKRSGSKHSRATDSDESDDGGFAYDSDEEEILERKKRGQAENDSEVYGFKKRKLLRVDAIAAELSGKVAAAEAEEDAFWGVSTSKESSSKDAKSGEKSTKGRSQEKDTESKTKKRGRSPSLSPARSPSSSPPPHLLKRNATGLPSPPQSRRHKSPRVLPFPIPVKAGEPSTPPRKARGNRGVRRKLFPERDSPHNPFLEDSKTSGSVDDSSPEAGSSEPRTPQPYVEKPTITYVFRGVRTEFDNPLYDPKYPTGVPPVDADDPSKLPPEHPDFEAEPYCPPKLLFPEAHVKSKRKSQKKGIPKPEEAEGSAEEKVLVRTPGHDKSKGKAKAVTLTREPLAEEAGVSEATAEKLTSKRRSVPKKAARSEWDTTDDEADGPDDDHLSPPERTPLPKGMKPALKLEAAAPVAARHSVSRPAEEPSPPGKSEEAVRSARKGSKERSRSLSAPDGDDIPHLPEKAKINPAGLVSGSAEKAEPAKA